MKNHLKSVLLTSALIGIIWGAERSKSFAMGNRDTALVTETSEKTARKIGDDFACRVVGISDGDTVTCLTAEKITEKIRLAEIDAPEKRQAFGESSKENLSELIYNKQVKVTVGDRDRYGRIVGYIRAGDQDVNYAQIADGMAHFYRDYGKTPAYAMAETKAKSKKIGLWSERNVTRPQDFRKIGAAAQTDNQATGSVVGADCKKKTCKEMVNCDEAYAVLQNCGYSSLDGDGDGIPCAALCKSDRL
jgi:endonuclease YncB( thermonuclease family)